MLGTFQMFTLALSQVVLSLLFNSTIANGLLRYDGNVLFEA